MFGSKKKVTVGTTVSRVIEDDTLPNAIKTALIQSLLSKSSPDLTENMISELVGSIGVRAERMYTYASKHYVHGLPSGSTHAQIQGWDEVKARLEQIEGKPVEMDYYQYGPPNALHIGWIRLINEHGWNQETNELPLLTAQKGTTVWLEDMTVVVPSMDEMNPQMIGMWGIPARAGTRPGRSYNDKLSAMLSHSPVLEDPTVPAELVRVTYCWMAVGPVVVGDNLIYREYLHTDTFDLLLDGYDEASDYAHAKYKVDGAYKWWMYRIGQGTYPELDAIHDTPQTIGTFFPFAYFRYEKKSEIEDTTTEAYKTSKRMVKYLGMDYDAVAEAIDENPDIADVEQAMLTFAIPANTEHELERRYLFEFFDNWFKASPHQYTDPIQRAFYSWQARNEDLAKSSIVIQDKRFKMVLHNAGIFKKLVAGSIGPKGSYDSAMEDAKIEYIYTVSYDENGTLPEPKPVTRMIPVKTHIYRHQVAETAYEEIRVVGLTMMYYVYGQYAVTADEDDEILLIPIDRAVTEHYSIPDRELLYARGLHFVFNSLIITKVKWYQTGFFQWVMVVVAVVISVISMGSSLHALAIAMQAGSMAALSAAAWALLQDIFMGFVFAFVFKLFTEVVGADIALLIAAVAILYGGYQAIMAGSIKGAPWAEELLKLGTGLAQGVQDYTAELMADLLAEASEFQKWMEEQTKLLESGRELLQTSFPLNPLVVFGESPEDYYNRTIHSGNIGMLGINAVSNYVDAALTLPRIHETIRTT